MRRIGVFAHVLRHSLFPFDSYYKKVRKTHFSFSLTYYFALIFLVLFFSILIKAALFAYSFPPQILKTYIETSAKEYPENLIIKMNPNGRLSTNDDRPYILSSPLQDNPRPLIVIDPKAHKDKIHDYDAFVLLSERRMFIQYDNTIVPYPYEIGHSYSFTKSKIQLIAENSGTLLDSYWKFLGFALIAGLIVGFPAIAFSYLLTLLFAAVIIYIILKITVKHKTITYKSVLQICLHAVTGPILLQGLGFIAGLSPSIPHWYTLILWVFLAGAVYESYFEKSNA